MRYATERLLYRLSRSPHADRFILKGGILLLAWLGETIRPTRDLDLLGFGELDDRSLARMFAEVCEIQVESDGIEFDAGSIRVEAIRPEDAYGGQRLNLIAHLGPARVRVQVDVGIGDSVVPNPEWLEYPSLLGFPRPRLRAYRMETSIAEKVHAMVVLGTKNSRMRDFFDVHALSIRTGFSGDTLVQAIRATFARRGTVLPPDAPIALTREFSQLEGKEAQWAGFLRRNRLTAAPQDLGVVIDALAAFLSPVLAAARRGESFGETWAAGGPWS